MEPSMEPIPGPAQSAPAYRTFSNAVGAACIAEAMTLPIEVAKVRLQLQAYGASPAVNNSMFSVMSSIMRREGWTGLFKGLEAGMHKQVLYSGLRLGLYDHFAADENASVATKAAYAMATTTLGIIVANPSDVVQVKYMAPRERAAAAAAAAAPHVPMPGAADTPRKYATATATAALRPEPSGASAAPMPRGPSHDASASSAPAPQSRRAFSVAADAVDPLRRRPLAREPRSYWRSTLSGPPDLPATTVNRAVCHDHRRRLHQSSMSWSLEGTGGGGSVGPRTSTGVPLRGALHAYYVISKEEGILKGLYRGFGANFACSGIQGTMAGVVATILSNPFDVVATRLMVGKRAGHSADSSILTVMTNILKYEGVLGFYKGFFPNMWRIGSFNVIMWLSYEQIRRL